MIRFLLKLWGKFPVWVHGFASILLRPKFRVAVAVLVFDDHGQILLFKHTYRKFPWGIPAGALEYNEQPIDAVIREFYEECGMKLGVERLLLADASQFFRHVTLVYLGRVEDGEFRESHEISEMQYFDINDLPPMLLDEKDLIRSVDKNLFSSVSLE